MSCGPDSFTPSSKSEEDHELAVKETSILNEEDWSTLGLICEYVARS